GTLCDRDPALSLHDALPIFGVHVLSPGHAAAEIQRTIAEPYAKVLRNVRGVEHVDAVALDGVAHVTAVFAAAGTTNDDAQRAVEDRKSTRLNSSHVATSYAV